MEPWHWAVIGIYIPVYLISVRWVFRRFMKTGWKLDAGPLFAMVLSVTPFPINGLGCNCCFYILARARTYVISRNYVASGDPCQSVSGR